MADAINAALQNKKTEAKTVNQKINLQKELKTYESTGNVTNNLEKLLDDLMTNQPISIESERVFSPTSNFCTKNDHHGFF